MVNDVKKEVEGIKEVNKKPKEVKNMEENESKQSTDIQPADIVNSAGNEDKKKVSQPENTKEKERKESRKWLVTTILVVVAAVAYPLLLHNFFQCHECQPPKGACSQACIKESKQNSQKELCDLPSEFSKTVELTTDYSMKHNPQSWVETDLEIHFTPNLNSKYLISTQVNFADGIDVTLLGVELAKTQAKGSWDSFYFNVYGTGRKYPTGTFVWDAGSQNRGEIRVVVRLYWPGNNPTQYTINGKALKRSLQVVEL